MPAAASTRPSRTRAGGSTPSSTSRGSPKTWSVGPSRHDPTRIQRHDPMADPVEQIRLVLGDQQRRAGLCELPEGLPDQPGPGWIELGRRLVEDDVSGAHRQQGGDADELGLAARQPRGMAHGDGLEPKEGQGRATSFQRLGQRQAQVHRAERDFFEDGRDDARALGIRVLEADDDALAPAGRSSGRPSVRRRSSGSPSVPRPPTPGPARTRPGRAWTFRPRSRRRVRRSRRRRWSGRCRGARSSHTRGSDS